MVEAKLSSKKNPPVVLLVGEDYYRKRDYVDRLKGGSQDPFNHEVFDAGECDGGRIVSACMTLPFGDGIRLIMVRNADDLLENDREILAEYMDNPCPTTCLVLLFQKLDKRSKLFREAQKRDWVKSCSALPERKLLPWLIDKARSSYVKDLSPDAARCLVDFVGTDLIDLVNEMEKLSLYVGDRKEIRPEDVEEIVMSRRQPEIWALMSAVADKNEGSALRVYSRLVRRPADVYGILGLLRWNINRIWIGREMLLKGAPEDEIGKRLNVRSYYMGDFITKAQSFQEEELYRNYRLLLKADWQIKSGQGDPRGVVERLIMALCS